MNAYGYASETLLFQAMGAGLKKLTAANLEQQEAHADAGGSGVSRLVRKALLDKLPFEEEDPDHKQMATLMAFKAIVSALEELYKDEYDQEIEAVSTLGFRAEMHDYLSVARPGFVLDAWQEAMNESGWTYHYKKALEISDVKEEYKEKSWLQKGDRKVEAVKALDVIIGHAGSLIEFHVRKLAFLLTDRVTMEEWLQTFDRDDTPTDRQWMEKRLKVILRH